MLHTVPYRADHVRSLLRPGAVQAAREIYITEPVGPDRVPTCDELRKVEDEAIKEAVAMQESIGLNAVTDGEFRRSFCRNRGSDLGRRRRLKLLRPK